MKKLLSNIKRNAKKVASQASPAFKKAADIASAANGCFKNEGWYTAPTAALQVVQKFVELAELSSDDWIPMHDLSGSGKVFTNLLLEDGENKETGKLGGSDVAIISFRGAKLAMHIEPRWSAIFLHKDFSREQLNSKMREALLEKYGSSIDVRSSMGCDGWSTDISLASVDYRHHSSSFANDVLSDIRKYIDAGFTRSVMFRGDPGTGKTSLMLHVAESMPGTKLVIDGGTLSTSIPSMLLEMLEPTVVIIDDIDRQSSDIERKLAFLERVPKYARVFLVAVNHYCSLDKAIVRPGRFDSIVSVRRGDMVSSTDGLPDDLVEMAEDWPVAFVEELKKRFAVYGNDRQAMRLDSLINRVSENAQDFDDEDTEEKTLRVIKR